MKDIVVKLIAAAAAFEMKASKPAGAELARLTPRACGVWSRGIVYLGAGAVSRHYYHYFCICVRSRNSC